MRIPQMSQDQQPSFPPPGEGPEMRHHSSQSINPRTSQNSFVSNESKRSRNNTNISSTNNAQSGGHEDATTSRYNQARQPINDAITSAFTSTESPLSPTLLSQLTTQITQNVLQQLQAHPLPTPAVPMGTSFTTEPVDMASSVEGSPPLDRAKVYTPPSPYRAGEEAAQTQTSPRGRAMTGQPVYGQASPPKRDISPFSQASYAGETDARDGKLSRPSGPKRTSTGGDTTVLEKIWGKLFDPQGQPTVRLGQFLRGIAVHLIEDYEPKHSLVITPDKLQKYYEDTRVANEVYPWQVVFDDRTSSISRLFRELSVQHHLVQEEGGFAERPDIPGLTPPGFETWATLVLYAHPDQEFERLAKTALDMPINNPDNMKERFPKELSRRQFPKDADLTVAAKLQRAMATHCNINIPSRNNSNVDTDATPSQPSQRTADTFQPPPASIPTVSFADKLSSSATPTSASPYRQTFENLERTTSAPGERLPYSHPASNTPSEAAIEEEHSDAATPKPLERERKPYVANPGGGKTYDVESHSADEKRTQNLSADSEGSRIKRATSVSHSNKPKPTPIAIHQKETSTNESFPDLQRARTHPNSQPRDIPPSRNRNRSPSLSKVNDYRWSEGDVKYGSYQPGSSSSQDGHRSGTSDRYAHRAQSTYDPHDTRDQGRKERDSRPRYQSVSGPDGHYYVPSSHSYHSGGNTAQQYASTNGTSYSTSASTHSQHPPNSYRDGR